MEKNRNWDENELIRSMLKSYLCIIAAFAIGILLCWLLSGCKHVEYIEKETVKHDSIYMVRELRDSIYVHDSISVEPQETQTIVTKWHTEYKYITRADTAFVNRTDTVYVKQSAEKGKSKRDKGMQWWKVMIWVAVGFGVGYIITWIARCLKRV